MSQDLVEHPTRTWIHEKQSFIDQAGQKQKQRSNDFDQKVWQLLCVRLDAEVNKRTIPAQTLLFDSQFFLRHRHG